MSKSFDDLTRTSLAVIMSLMERGAALALRSQNHRLSQKTRRWIAADLATIALAAAHTASGTHGMLDEPCRPRRSSRRKPPKTGRRNALK